MSRIHDLVNPTIMGDETTMHALFTELRENDPITYFEHPDYRPFWVLTRHEDIKYISQNNDLFINNPRTVIVPKEFEVALLEHLQGHTAVGQQHAPQGKQRQVSHVESPRQA